MGESETPEESNVRNVTAMQLGKCAYSCIGVEAGLVHNLQGFFICLRLVVLGLKSCG